MKPLLRLFLACGVLTLTPTVASVWSQAVASQPSRSPADAARSAVLSRALEAVGIAAILDDVAPALDAALPESCATAERAHRQSVFDTDRLLVRFERSLSSRLGDATLAEVARWYDSDEGRAVARSEAKSATLADETVAERIPSIAGAADWPTRKALVRATLQASRTAPFLTRFHTTLDGIVARAGHCNPDPVTLERLATAHAEAQANEAFVALFIDIELIVPTAVIYAALPDATLQAYARFARSPAGVQWFTALQDTIGITLQQAGDRYLEQRARDIAGR